MLQPRSLAILLQVVTALDRHVTAHDLSYVHVEDSILYFALAEMMAATEAAPKRYANLRSALNGFAQRVASLHVKADANQQPSAEAELKLVWEAYRAVEELFPEFCVAEAQKSIEILSCANHTDVVGGQNELCPKCGAKLTRLVRIIPPAAERINPSQGEMQASVRPKYPVTAGQPAEMVLRLQKTNGDPVLPFDLMTAHTRKIHLLLVDPSLTDFHHEHPEPTDTPGDYAFTFTPSTSGHYRMWADLQPYPSGRQQYAIAHLRTEGPSRPLTDRDNRFKATLEGLTYELVLAEPDLKAGVPTMMRLRITTAERKGFTQLEPVMDNFAHLVGFHEDYETVLHLHPKGPPVADAQDRGGPELEFHLYSPKAGFFRIFAQVQIDGTARVVPFGVHFATNGAN